MVHYFYKSEKKDQQPSYIDCEWLNNIDFESADAAKDLSICTITLNNISHYWSGTVTRRDLDNFVNENASLPKLAQAVSAGLKGETGYESQALSWKITHRKDKCKMALISYMGGSLAYEMGSIEIPSVPELKKHQVMHDWMENTMKQCLTYKQTQRSLSERNRDLVDYKEKMEKELEDLTREKVESDMINIQKMKQLLNSKKRRLHKVMMERDSLLRQVVAHQAQDQSLKDQNEGSPIPIKKAASKKRGRPPASAASASASVSETQIDVARRKRMRTTPPPPSDQTEPSSSTQNVEKKDTKSSSSSSSGKKNGSRQDDPGGGSETDEDDAAGATVPGGKTAKIQKEATAIELDSDSDDYDSYIPKVRRAKIGNRSQKKRLARNASEEDDESGQSD